MIREWESVQGFSSQNPPMRSAAPTSWIASEPAGPFWSRKKSCWISSGLFQSFVVLLPSCLGRIELELWEKKLCFHEHQIVTLGLLLKPSLEKSLEKDIPPGKCSVSSSRGAVFIAGVKKIAGFDFQQLRYYRSKPLFDFRIRKLPLDLLNRRIFFIYCACTQVRLFSTCSRTKARPGI